MGVVRWRWPSLHCFVWAGLCCAAGVVAVVGYAQAASDPIPLTEVAAIKALDRSQASAGLPVSVELVVSYSDPFWQFLFGLQGDEAIFVYGGFGDFKPGDRVRIDGVTSPGDLMSIVEAAVVTHLGEDRLPPPRAIDLEHLPVGRHDCSWIETESVVRQVVVRDRNALLWCADGDVTFLINLAARLPVDAARELVGARVRVRGNLGYLVEAAPFEQPGSVRAPVPFFQIFTQDLNQLDVLKKAPPGRRREGSNTIREVQRDSFEALEFVAQGQITLLESGHLVVQDDRSGLSLKAWNTAELEVGQIVQILGARESSPASSLGASRFSALVIRPITMAPLPQPRERSVASLMQGGGVDFQRISTRGRLSEYWLEEGIHFCLLESEGVRFLVSFPAGESADSVQPETIEAMGVTGVFLPEVSGELDAAFEVRVGRIEDLRVLERAAFFPLRPVLAGFGALAAVLGLILLWVRTLRRRVAEKTQDLAALTARLLSSYEAIEDGLVALDPEGQLVAMNRHVGRLFGVDLELGTGAEGLRDAVAGGLRESASFVGRWNAIVDDPEAKQSFELQLDGSRQHHLLVSTAPIRRAPTERPLGRLWLFRDETERRRLESSLLQAQKMEAVGNLAGGIAHDFNNLLTVIAGNLSVARLGPDRTVAEVDEDLEAAEEAAMRAADLVKQLLSFSRKTELRLDTCDLNGVIRRLEKLLRPTFDANIEIRLDLEKALPEVSADATLMEQVLLNLSVNARDAMKAGGVLTLGTAVESVAGGECVVIRVNDTGAGMSEEVRTRIFEPFFTTKAKGAGTGLGLAVSFGVIQQHGGRISCTSRPGDGTEFRIELPVAADSLPGPTGHLDLGGIEDTNLAAS